MSRSTRPLQYLDANNNVLQHLRSDDAMRASLLNGSNVIYLAYARENAAENQALWQIRKFAYTNNQLTSITWQVNSDNVPSKDYIFVWDYGYYASIDAITNANPGVVTLTATTYSDGISVADGDIVQFESATGMTEVNDVFYQVASWNLGAKTFTLTDLDGNAIDTSAYGVYAGSGKAYKRTYANATYS